MALFVRCVVVGVCACVCGVRGLCVGVWRVSSSVCVCARARAPVITCSHVRFRSSVDTLYRTYRACNGSSREEHRGFGDHCYDCHRSPQEQAAQIRNVLVTCATAGTGQLEDGHNVWVLQDDGSAFVTWMCRTQTQLAPSSKLSHGVPLDRSWNAGTINNNESNRIRRFAPSPAHVMVMSRVLSPLNND